MEYTIADPNVSLEEKMREMLPPHALMRKHNGTELTPQQQWRFNHIADDYNVAFDEEEGPLAYYVISHVDMVDIYGIADKFRTYAIGLLPQAPDTLQYDLTFILTQFAFIMGSPQYLREIITEGLPQDVVDTLNFNIDRLTDK